MDRIEIEEARTAGYGAAVGKIWEMSRKAADAGDPERAAIIIAVAETVGLSIDEES